MTQTATSTKASPQAAIEPLLLVDDLHSGYGDIPILSGLSLRVNEGEFVGILGHNGMGKTTLLRSLMGYLPTTGGRITFRGRDLRTASTTARARAGMGYVPQGREIFPGLSVYENLRMGCLLSSDSETAIIERILEFFPRLKAYLDRPGGALSGGEQQLLALARCLCGEPKVILLDEPTEGIQPSLIDEIIEQLLRLGREGGMTILLVEQNLNFITALSSRILILRKGTITRELLPSALHDRALIDEFVGM